MTLSEIVSLIRESRDLLRELDPNLAARVEQGLDVITDVQGGVTDAQAELVRVQMEKARQIVESLDKEIIIAGEDRLKYADEEIRILEDALQNAENGERNILVARLRQAKINKAALLAADVFQGFIIFDDSEIEKINELMAAAERDLANRQQLAAAINVTVNVLKTSLSVAKKLANFS